MAKIDNVEQKRDFLLKSQKQFEQAQRQLRRECSHQKLKNDQLKLTIESVGNGLFRCKRCGDEFSMEEISLKELQTARTIMHNAIQQIRCLSDITNRQDRDLSQDLGSVDASLDNIVRLYERTNNTYRKGKKKNKNKNKKGSKFGGYTSLNNSIGGGRF